MNFKLYRKIASLFVLLCFTTAYAQAAECSAVVQQAMSDAQTACASTGRNQACYGFVALQATARDGVQNFSFSKAGDIANVADLTSLQLTPLDTAKNTWGIALMKLQANLPDTLPGENVTFLLFGNVKITNAATPQGANAATPEAQATAQAAAAAYAPMQAFYFQTGVAQTKCAAAPADGILIQTPKGAGMINLRANNVDIKLGSTAYLQAQPGKNMDFYVVEGRSQIRSGGKTVIVPAGSEATIPLDEDLSASGEPAEPQAYDSADVTDLPISDLPDEIDVSAPASEADIQEADQEAIGVDQADDATQLEADNNAQLEPSEEAPQSSIGDETDTESPTDAAPAESGNSSDSGS